MEPGVIVHFEGPVFAQGYGRQAFTPEERAATRAREAAWMARYMAELKEKTDAVTSAE